MGIKVKVMIKKQKLWIFIFIALGLILLLTAYIYAEEVRDLTMKDCDCEREDNNRLETGDIKIRDCPKDLDQSGPSRTVSQIINNTFYRWKEYKLDDGGFCILMEKPEYRYLTAEEAMGLLEKSGKWVDQTPDPDEGRTLEPTDPRFDFPLDPMPYIDEPPFNNSQLEETDSFILGQYDVCKKAESRCN